MFVRIIVLFAFLIQPAFAQEHGFGLIPAPGYRGDVIAFDNEPTQLRSGSSQNGANGGNVTSAKTLTWSVEPNGHMFGISHAETIRQMENGFREVEAVCGIDLKRVRSGGRLRYSFHDNQGMRITIGGEVYYALGLAYSGGRIKLNNERPIAADVPGNRNVQIVTVHEAFHSDRFMGWSHSSNPRCMISLWPSKQYFCQAEVRLLQQKYGPPKSLFYPVDRAIAGKRVNELTAERQRLLALRDGSTDPVYRRQIQDQVLANLPKLSAAAKDWFETNNYWRGVPFAHVVN